MKTGGWRREDRTFTPPGIRKRAALEDPEFTSFCHCLRPFRTVLDIPTVMGILPQGLWISCIHRVAGKIARHPAKKPD